MKRLVPVAALLAAACSTPDLPAGPNLLALPGTGKTFDEFRADEQACRNVSQSDVAARAKEVSDFDALQRRYDAVFTQCMYAKGHKVPVRGNYQSNQSKSSAQAARTPPPPPPPGQPPAEAPPDYRPK
jgi:hypothetical protein